MHLAFHRVLRGNEHHAEGAAGTVDCRGRGIFQDRDTFDIIRVHGRQVALHAIHEHQCAASGTDAAHGTTDLDVRTA